MDFTLSDEQRAFQETARDFAHDEWLPYAPGWDQREEFPVEALRRAAALGFAGIYVHDQFGGTSDLYVAMVRTGEPGPKGISCLVVEKGAKGLSFGKKERKLGWNTQPTAMVIFEDCHVPVANRLGAEGDGFMIAMMGLDGGRLNIGACSLGGGRACWQAARDYLLERRQFGQRLADFQALQVKLADMATELDAARLMLWRAAASLDAGLSEATMQCAMAKRLATDAGFHVANEALQLHGGYGYLKDFPIERYLRDVRVHQILEGTNEIMRVIIARHLLRQ
jgi:alkylation response protein AidB-like acyl-CoA dehydrogenase